MTKLMKDMDEPTLKKYFNGLMSMLQSLKTPDCHGFMLIAFQDDGITQYASSIDPMTAPDALRELADRLERREDVKR